MSFKNGRVAKVCIWLTKAKEAMGLLLIAYAFFYLLFGFFVKPGFQGLDLFTFLQMAFASFFVGVVRQTVIPPGVLNRWRGILWLVSGVVITVGFSLFFDWFGGFPIWCPLVFWGLMAAGFAAMIMEYYFELHQETRLLNVKLEQFQSGKAAERTDHAEG